jgi:transcriptional regulator with XRE-family HTH domain
VAGLGGALQTTAITRIERGDRDVSLEDALLLAAALDVSPLYLIVPREADVIALLAPRGRSYPPIHLREWIRGQWALNTIGVLDISAFFASERALDEVVLWSEKYIVHRFCTMLAATVAGEILDTEGVGPVIEPPEHRLEAIERRLRTVVEEVESYVAGRRRQLSKED